jgi:hypothetical protein
MSPNLNKSVNSLTDKGTGHASRGRIQAIINSLMKHFKGGLKDKHTLIETAGQPNITNGWAKLRNYFRDAGFLRSVLDYGTRDPVTEVLMGDMGHTPRHLKNKIFLENIRLVQAQNTESSKTELDRFNALVMKLHHTVKKGTEKEAILREIKKEFRSEKQKKIVMEHAAKTYYNNILNKNQKEIRKIGLWKIL